MNSGSNKVMKELVEAAEEEEELQKRIVLLFCSVCAVYARVM